MEKCLRCGEVKNAGPRCKECGVSYDRVVRRSRRSHPIGGKRGRNSGTVSSGNKKKH